MLTTYRDTDTKYVGLKLVCRCGAEAKYKGDTPPTGWLYMPVHDRSRCPKCRKKIRSKRK